MPATVSRIAASIALLAATLSAPSPARAAAAPEDPSGLLTFEACGATGDLSGWRGHPSGPEGTVFLDSTTVHGGRYSGLLRCGAESPLGFSALAHTVSAGVSGDSVTIRGWLKLDGVKGWAGLWQRQDGRTPSLQFDNMESKALSGSVDWSEYAVTLPFHPKARTIVVGALLVGEGSVWVDDLRLLVDGRPIQEAPERVVTPSPIERDHEFDGGSRVSIETPTAEQIENLILLGKVWGLLKYHHPRIVRGERHWDYDLFRVLPSVLAARDRAAAERALCAWIDSLGAVPPCAPCAAPPEEGPLRPRLAWIDDARRVGPELAARLRHVHANRLPGPEQYFALQEGSVGNPDFGEEASYPSDGAPDAGFRLLALYRFWNIVEYWFPYRDLLEEDWDATLREFIPLLLAAKTRDDYLLRMIALSARVHDTHANLHGSLGVRPPRGDCRLPVTLRPVAGRFVVASLPDSADPAGSGLRRGDIVTALDGHPVDSLVAAWSPLYPASNEPTRRRDLAIFLGRGDCGTVRLSIERAGRKLDAVAERVRSKDPSARAPSVHDHPGAACRRLSSDLAYLTLSKVKAAEAADYVRRAEGAKCLVIDLRNYPSDFVVFALGAHLVSVPTPFVTFTTADPANPGAFAWRSEPLSLAPAEPRFEGRVAILVDEATQSSAEYHAMAFRAAPGATVVGSTTAGADGNASPIPLPGGVRGLITGLGVYYPDRRPTQRIGIVPDLVVHPTIEGIREGRDEVLEAAVRHVLGREMTDEERSALRRGE